jgi:hypothetical protein
MAFRDTYGPAWLKTTALLGVDTTLDDGSDFPDLAFEEAIDDAAAEVESALSLVGCFDVATVTAKHALHSSEREGFFPLFLDHRPVQEILSVSLGYGAAHLADVPIEWVDLTNPLQGTAHVMPTSGLLTGHPYLLSLHALPLAPTPPHYDIFARVGGGVVPSYWRVEYRHGFTTIPHDVKRAVGLRAALGLLAIAGDLIIQAGIASRSVSMDGLSQSINSTASAMYSGYSGRAVEYEKQYKALMEILKRKYRSIRMAAI